jgi:hypothetical protein
MAHPWLGELYYQEGRFFEMDENHLSDVKTLYVTDALIRAETMNAKARE